MTSINTQHLIEQQVPFHIRESNPVFNKFLEYYYQFQTQSKIPDIIQEVRKYNDIDATEEQFLLEFFEEFKFLPANIVANKRLVAKHIYDIYKSKGSENSLKLLFRIVYGEEVDVYYPSEDILRASDGRWIQNNIVTVELIDGEIKTTSNRIVIENSHGVFDFLIESIDDVRVFFNPNRPYFVDDNQLVRIYTDSTLDFIGSLVLMPSILEIIDGGAFWQLGQLIVLPGDTNTIAQITRLGENGSIKKLDIIQYGTISTSQQVYSISPFSFTPNSAYTETYSEQISTSPAVWNHNINVIDHTHIQDVTNIASAYQDYIIDGYVLSGYITNEFINQITSLPESNLPDITLDQWIQSKARIRLKQQFFAKTAGFYEDLRGQLSAANIRLQDNFFYQLFSYVVNTTRVLSDIKNVISLVHPAGMKYFINTLRESVIDIDVTTSRILSREPLYFTTGFEFGETLAFDKTLHLYEVIEPTTLSRPYDLNDSYHLYDPEVDWDEILRVSGDFDSEGFDSEDFDYTSEFEVNQYTLEEDSIDVRLWLRLYLNDHILPTTVNVADQYDLNNSSYFYDESIDWDAITLGGGFDLQNYDLAHYTITEEFEQYTLEDDSIRLT